MYEPAAQETGAVFPVATTSLRLPTLMGRVLPVTWLATRLGPQTTFKEWARPDYMRKYGLNTPRVRVELFV